MTDCSVILETNMKHLNCCQEGQKISRISVLEEHKERIAGRLPFCWPVLNLHMERKVVVIANCTAAVKGSIENRPCMGIEEEQTIVLPSWALKVYLGY